MVSGRILSELGELTVLQNLAIGQNAFTGVLPSELGQLYSLVLFDTSRNELIGTIPSELAQLESLETFRFFENLLTGSANVLCVSTDQLTILEGDCLVNGNWSVEIECGCCTTCH